MDLDKCVRTCGHCGHSVCKDLSLWPLCFVKTDVIALGEPSTCLSPCTANHAVMGGNFWVSRERDVGGSGTEGSPRAWTIE